jgi:hypothetical protein
MGSRGILSAKKQPGCEGSLLSSAKVKKEYINNIYFCQTQLVISNDKH